MPINDLIDLLLSQPGKHITIKGKDLGLLLCKHDKKRTELFNIG